ncbi:MAG: indolepyruvate oxidoreductase subunit beta [Bacillota bacterium]|nr:indolepyruvate oxidoreductase subunit beta [Bacillota bacterium]
MNMTGEKNINIIIAGVGGQGLVLTTKIMAEAAMTAGYDVKTNDVIGLSQRNGKIWGSVRLGTKVYSPNIPEGEADILLAFEALEARRMRHMLREGDSIAIVNSYEMAPARVQQGLETYADDIDALLMERSVLKKVDATAVAVEIGHAAVANIFMLGIAAQDLPIPVEVWESVIAENVPPNSIELNRIAFRRGLEWK